MTFLRSFARSIVSAGVICFPAIASADELTCVVSDPGPLDAVRVARLSEVACTGLARRHAPAGPYRVSLVPLESGWSLQLAGEAGSTRMVIQSVDDAFVSTPELAEQYVRRLVVGVEAPSCGLVHVRFEPTTKEASLYRIAHRATDGQWLCTGACDVEVPACDSVQVRGEGGSSPLAALEAKPGDRIVVRGKPRTGGTGLGVFLIVAGSIGSLVGMSMLGDDHTPDTQVVGALLWGASAIATGAGIAACVGAAGKVKTERVPEWKDPPRPPAAATLPFSLRVAF